jgi:hypothetical protein
MAETCKQNNIDKCEKGDLEAHFQGV